MSADEALQEYKQQYPNAISHMRMLLSNTETPSFMTTPNADQLEYTLLDILGKPTHLSQSPPSTPPTPQSTIKDVFVNDFQPTAMSQKDLSLDLHPSVAQLGQLHENLAQQLPQSQTDQTQVNGVPRSIDPQITVVMTPPMVGSTWLRVRSTLESDCLPALSQGTASFCLIVD